MVPQVEYCLLLLPMILALLDDDFFVAMTHVTPLVMVMSPQDDTLSFRPSPQPMAAAEPLLTLATMFPPSMVMLPHEPYSPLPMPAE